MFKLFYLKEILFINVMNVIEDYWINNVNEEEKPLIITKIPEQTINYQYLEYVNENHTRNTNLFFRIFNKLFCCYGF